MSGLPTLLRSHWQPMLLYSLVSLLILWPLLSPGFILTLDMVFTPTLAMPDIVTSSFLFRAVLHALNLVIPGDVVQKLVLFAILALSGLGMYRLVRSLQLSGIPALVATQAAYVSGLLYMVNPFTYSRFMAGQYSVLLGYACIPFFVVALLRFLRDPTPKKSFVLIAWVIGVSIVSIHTLGLIFVLGLIASLQALWHYRRNTHHLKRLTKYGLIAGFSFLIASSYWLLPLLQGSGTTAESIATFATSDQSAFATSGDGAGGKLMHALRLQGFWAERTGMYLLPQDIMSMWGIAATAVWILVIVGAVTAWRQNRETFVLVTSVIVIGALLAAGVGTSWLAVHVPLFAGYREPQKFVGLVALGYAIFVGFALPKLFSKLHSKVSRLIAGIVLLFVFVGFTPVMFSGFNGQLTPRHYPGDWYVANQRLNQDNDSFQVLFLPWHLYMDYGFTKRVIASPGEGFFDKPFLVSDNPELGNVKPALVNTKKQLLSNQILPQAASSRTLGQQLAPLNVKYVLLAKNDDYMAYGYLDDQSDLQLISETETLKLYRNTAFKKGSK